jgi:hypothetical protein
MTPARRTYLKNIMDLAWGLYRAELNGPCPRTFANALSGAWAWTKRQAAAAKPAWANGTHSRTLYLASPVQSPIRRATVGPYAFDRSYRAGRLTSRLGA